MSAQPSPVKQAPVPWIVYMVRCRDGTFYTGVTTDLQRRVREHDTGRGARYTRGRGPVRVVLVEVLGGRGAALRREAAIKRLPAAAKRALVAASSRAGAARAPRAPARAPRVRRRT